VLMRGIGLAVVSGDFDKAALQATLEHFTAA
jgi:3-dehydroquinate synthase